VPEAVSRTREVWTRDDGRLIDRALALMQSRGDKVLQACAKPTCSDRKIERVSIPGGYALRCGCRDRVFLARGV